MGAAGRTAHILLAVISKVPGAVLGALGKCR
jgi:hypothetical protein